MGSVVPQSLSLDFNQKRILSIHKEPLHQSETIKETVVIWTHVDIAIIIIGTQSSLSFIHRITWWLSNLANPMMDDHPSFWYLMVPPPPQKKPHGMVHDHSMGLECPYMNDHVSVLTEPEAEFKFYVVLLLGQCRDSFPKILEQVEWAE